MGKHAADKPRTPETGERLKRYAGIERDSGPSRQTEELQKRPRAGRDESKRAAEFVRIERGKEA